MMPRENQRVFFANAPWWVPMAVLSAVLFGGLGYAAVGFWSDQGATDPVRDELAAAVERFRGGDEDGAVAQLEDGTHVTVRDGLTLYGTASDETGACWVVRVDTDRSNDRDDATGISGPLPGPAEQCGTGS